MYYYAYENGITSSQLQLGTPGYVQIDEQEYLTLLTGIISGKQISIQNGLPVLRDPEGEIETPVEPKTWEQALSLKLAELDGIRVANELAGVEFFGQVMRTDLHSQAKITGAVTYLLINPGVQVIEFEPQDNVWVDIPREFMIGLGNAVGAHVQGTYSKKRRVQEQLNQIESVQELLDFDLQAAWDSIDLEPPAEEEPSEEEEEGE